MPPTTNDVWDAIERLSADLSLRIERIAGGMQLGTKPYSYIVANNIKTIIIVSTTVSFPSGHYASFSPRPEPTGDTWQIDVRRTDGVERGGWTGGLYVMKGSKGYDLLREGSPISDDALAQMIYELAQR